MTHEQLLERIVTDPAICHGKPCIRGHRIWVSLIIDLLADGMTTEQILEQYTGLEADDIRACVAYAAEMTPSRPLLTTRHTRPTCPDPSPLAVGEPAYLCIPMTN